METQSCFVCVFLIITDVEDFLKCLLVILNSSVESSLFRSAPYFFKTGFFFLLMTNFLSSLYNLEIRPLSNVQLVKIFSHSVG